VDGFDQDEGTGQGEEGGEVSRRLLTAQRDALEAFDLANRLFDAGAAFVEHLRKEGRFFESILSIWNCRANASFTRRLPV